MAPTAKDGMKAAKALYTNRKKFPNAIFENKKIKEVAEEVLNHEDVVDYRDEINQKTLLQYLSIEKSKRELTKPKGTGAGPVAKQKQSQSHAEMTVENALDILNKISEAEIDVSPLTQMQSQLKQESIKLDDVLTALSIAEEHNKKVKEQKALLSKFFPEERPAPARKAK